MIFSVVIPCYEMGNRGQEFLLYSLDILSTQSLSDFEVVVPDHSIDNKILEACKDSSLNIKYIRNEEKRGSSSYNTNVGILNSSGEYIKILCQDDFLSSNHSLEYTYNTIKDSQWLVSAYGYEDSRLPIHYPSLNPDLLFNNTIGTHSCLAIKNESPILFDDDLIWFMDCEYYTRLLNKYGEPRVLNIPTVTQRLWSGQVTNTLATQRVRTLEYEYLRNKYGKPN